MATVLIPIVKGLFSLTGFSLFFFSARAPEPAPVPPPVIEIQPRQLEKKGIELNVVPENVAPRKK